MMLPYKINYILAKHQIFSWFPRIYLFSFLQDGIAVQQGVLQAWEPLHAVDSEQNM